ncbi:MAG TPA: RNA polymerase sigma factor [Clostridia bacterium]|nr:RNA polymerase sigma factor [Clostridia bacterium]
MKRDFERFYLKTFDSVYGFILSRVYSKQDAEDLVGDIYYKACRSFNESTKLNKAWIFTIASNTLKNYYRDQKPTYMLSESVKGSENVEEWVISSERTSELMVAINQLSLEDQLIVSLRYFGELSYRDISKVMEISISAAKTRMSRCLVKLRKVMREERDLYEGEYS